MLSFQTTPGPLVPAGQRAEYRLESDRARTFDIRLTDLQTGELLGTKRFAEVAEAAFDASPIVRHRLHFKPLKSRTSGFMVPEDRRCRVAATAVAADDPDRPVVSAETLFHAGSAESPVPSFATTMPRQRLIAPGEWDELTLLSDEMPQITVTAAGPAGETRRVYNVVNFHVNLFRLHADDFPDAERITVEARAGGKIEYAVLPAPTGARRIAWRSSAGSIEHYTFPTEAEATLAVSKSRAVGPEGLATVAVAAERRLRLRSAYETRETLEALAEIVASPQVWIATDEGYRPVDVLTETATIHRHGVLSLLEIEIRPCETNDPTWK